MNAIVPVGTTALVPQTMDEAVRLAKIMSQAKLVPKHLQGDIASCFMVVEQAMRWRMSPFAVAQCASNINGKMMYEGKCIAAAVKSMGAITGNFDYAWKGEGDERTITVTATRTGDAEPRALQVRLADVKTANEQWKRQPDQQLAYAGSRIWARRWTPEALLGVYAPEEFDRTTGRVADDTGPIIEAEAEPEPKNEGESSRREQINTEVPIAPVAPEKASKRPMGWQDLVKAVQLVTKNATTGAQIDLMLGSDEVIAACAQYKDIAKRQLDDALAKASVRARELRAAEVMDKTESALDDDPFGEPAPA